MILQIVQRLEGRIDLLEMVIEGVVNRLGDLEGHPLAEANQLRNGIHVEAADRYPHKAL
jgi:hypothetical protein